MIIYLSLFLFFFAIVFQKSKILANLIFIHMWVLWAFNTWNGDYEAYERIYIENSVFEPHLFNYEFGYKFANYLSSSLGLNFQMFQMLIAFVVLFCIRKVSFRLVMHIALFSAIYMIIFVMEYVYIRNYIAHAFILLGVYFLLEGKDKYKKVKMFLMLLLATSIHISSAIAFLFLLADSKRGEIINLSLFLPAIVISLLGAIFIFDPAYLSFLGSNVVLRVQLYQTAGGVSNIFIAQILIAVFMLYYRASILRTGRLSGFDKRLAAIVVNINILSLFYLCIYYYIPYFGRSFRFLMTLDLIFIIGTFKYYPYSTKLRAVTRGIVFFMVLGMVAVLFAKSTLYLTYKPLLENNMIWGDAQYRAKVGDE